MKEIMETVQKQIKEEIRDARQEIDEFRKEIHDIKNVTIELKRNGRSQVINVSDMILFGNMLNPNLRSYLFIFRLCIYLFQENWKDRHYCFPASNGQYIENETSQEREWLL